MASAVRTQAAARPASRATAGSPLPNLVTSRTPGAFQQRAPQKPAPNAQLPASPELEKRKEWMAFLRNNSLLHHADLLLKNGFDDMEAMIEMQDADMKDLGLPSHDAVRLRKSLQHLHGTGAQAVDEQNPVAVFLRECGLQQYAELLLRHGFEDMETLLEIQDADMRDLGLQRGHALKLAKRLRELGAGIAAPPPPAAQPLELRSRVPSAPSPLAPSAPLATAAQVALVPASKRMQQGLQSTEAQMSAVQRSWERVQHLGSYALGEKLYRHVFSVAPQTMELFPPEVRYKYRDWSADENGCEEGDLYDSPALRKLFGKVVNAVGVSVAGLREPSQMVPMLTQLGARHIHYGVDEGYWKVLGDGLILTLQECLGADFTLEVQLAWTLVYGFISAVMIEGLRGAIAAARGSSAGDGRGSCQDDRSSVRSECRSEPLRSVSEDRERLQREELDAEVYEAVRQISHGSGAPEDTKAGMMA